MMFAWLLLRKQSIKKRCFPSLEDGEHKRRAVKPTAYGKKIRAARQMNGLNRGLNGRLSPGRGNDT